MMNREADRKLFLKIAAATSLAIAARFLLRSPMNVFAPDIPPSPVFSAFDTGLHNGHLIDGFAGVTVRVPLNRRRFDPSVDKTKFSSVQLDPFYGKKERLLDYRIRGSRIALVMDLYSGDTENMLARMLDYAVETVGLQRGDSVVLGNEINARMDSSGNFTYPPKKYLSQARFLHRKIKEINPEIQTGISGEAWWGHGEYLKKLLSVIDFPFDFLPVYYYGKPYEIPSRIGMYREILSDYNLEDIPVSIGETGVADSSYPDNPEGFLEAPPFDQAQILLKSFCFSKLAGCTSLNWYSALDTSRGEYMERFGLVSDKGKQRPLFAAFEKAAKIFNRPSSIDGAYTEGVWNFTLMGTDFITQLSWEAPTKNSLGGSVKISEIEGLDPLRLWLLGMKNEFSKIGNLG